jgi:hypothetical protein
VVTGHAVPGELAGVDTGATRARGAGAAPGSAASIDAMARPTSPASPRMRHATHAAPTAVTTSPRSRWRAVCGVLGIVAGALVFVGALVVPLDDPVLMVALGMWARAGRLILDVDS